MIEIYSSPHKLQRAYPMLKLEGWTVLKTGKRRCMYGLDASSFDYAGVTICGLLNACRLRASKSHALDVK